LRRSSSASMPTAPRTSLMSEADGEVLPARPRRRNAAMCFILTVSVSISVCRSYGRLSGCRARCRCCSLLVDWFGEQENQSLLSGERRLNLRVREGSRLSQESIEVFGVRFGLVQQPNSVGAKSCQSRCARVVKWREQPRMFRESTCRVSGGSHKAV